MLPGLDPPDSHYAEQKVFTPVPRSALRIERTSRLCGSFRFYGTLLLPSPSIRWVLELFILSTLIFPCTHAITAPIALRYSRYRTLFPSNVQYIGATHAATRRRRNDVCMHLLAVSSIMVWCTPHITRDGALVLSPHTAAYSQCSPTFVSDAVSPSFSFFTTWRSDQEGS